MNHSKQPPTTAPGRVLNPRRIASWLIAVIALVNAGLVVFQTSRQRSGPIQYDHLTIIVDPDPTFWAMKVRIALMFLISAGALLFRNSKARVLSIIALSWTLLEYSYWWLRSYRGARALEGRGQIDYLLFLFNANWLDVIVLAVVFMALAWQVGVCVWPRSRTTDSPTKSAT